MQVSFERYIPLNMFDGTNLTLISDVDQDKWLLQKTKYLSFVF